MNEKEDSLSQARIEAAKLAVAPFAFQAARTLRTTNVLSILAKDKNGATKNELLEKTKLSDYGLGVLLDAGISIGLLLKTEDKYFISAKGSFFLNDEIVTVGTDFTHDVCYKGLFDLEEAIKTGCPAGLKVFSEKKTIYEALFELPDHVQKSWLQFDHYFSDKAFPKALPVVFKNNPKTLLDIGGNTGKWAIQCAQYNKDVQISIVDHPSTLNTTRSNIQSNYLENRISLIGLDLLDHSRPLPEGFDVLWMSQFLDCFSPEDIVMLLKRAKTAMKKNSALYILETYIDRQYFETAAYFLNMTSLYFTCMANGNSRMYSSENMKEYIEESGLIINEEIDNTSISHTLFKCVLP